MNINIFLIIFLFIFIIIFIDIMWRRCYIVYIDIPTYIHLPLQEYNYLPI